MTKQEIYEKITNNYRIEDERQEGKMIELVHTEKLASLLSEEITKREELEKSVKDLQLIVGPTAENLRKLYKNLLDEINKDEPKTFIGGKQRCDCDWKETCGICRDEPKQECEHKFVDGETLKCSNCRKDPFEHEEKKQDMEELREAWLNEGPVPGLDTRYNSKTNEAYSYT